MLGAPQGPFPPAVPAGPAASGPVAPAASSGPASLTTPGALARPVVAGETVYAAIATWARRASHGRLTAWTVGGGVDARGIALFVPAVWPLALPFGCLASIGAWGLATRSAETLAAAGLYGTGRVRLLRVVRAAAVVAGTLLAVATFYTVLWMVLGPSWTL